MRLSMVGNLFSVTAVIDKTLKYKFPFIPNCPSLHLTTLWIVCLPTYIACVDLSHFTLLSVLPGGRDGSVQSDTSSSPSEQSQLGQSHPGYPIGPQVSEDFCGHLRICDNCPATHELLLVMLLLASIMYVNKCNYLHKRKQCYYLI